MDMTSFNLSDNEPIAASLPDQEPIAPWEEVAEGRFRPRRIRGSCVGRELG